MNYYDYRSYFNELIGNTEELYTELTQLHEDINIRLDTLNTTLQSGIGLLAALIVLSAAVKVMFK